VLQAVFENQLVYGNFCEKQFLILTAPTAMGGVLKGTQTNEFELT